MRERVIPDVGQVKQLLRRKWMLIKKREKFEITVCHPAECVSRWHTVWSSVRFPRLSSLKIRLHDEAESWLHSGR